MIDLDEVDKQLLVELTQDARASAAALAKIVGLTRQAVADRMERLKNEGIIRNYTTSLDPDKLGLSIRAFVAITLMPGCSENEEVRVIALLKDNPWVQECYRVTGEDYFQVRVIAPEIAALRQLVLDLRSTGVVQGTRTMLSLETLFEKNPVGYCAKWDE
jgi:Lrp/AsnC family leucine-responsive transcriptional regulator